MKGKLYLRGEGMKDIYYIYILRCEDDSLYTGIAKDYRARYEKHLAGTGAKYTRSRKPVRIERVWQATGRSEASRAEYFLKKNLRKTKERFIGEKDLFKDRVLEKLGIDISEIEELSPGEV